MIETQLCKLRGTSDIYTNYRSRVLLKKQFLNPGSTRDEHRPLSTYISVFIFFSRNNTRILQIHVDK